MTPEQRHSESIMINSQVYKSYGLQNDGTVKVWARGAKYPDAIMPNGKIRLEYYD